MKNIFKKLKLNEGNISLAMGIVVLMVAGVLLVNYLKSNRQELALNQEENISSASTEVTTTPELSPSPAAITNKPTLKVTANKPTVTPTSAPTVTKAPESKIAAAVAQPNQEYTIAKGDNLWRIAEKAYGSGYEWKKVYEANKSSLGNNPSSIATGTKISLPTISQDQAQAQVQEQKEPVQYTVVRGDNMWNIALQHCGSGFSYPSIATDNNVSNPRLIEPGLALKIQCPTRSIAARK